jgi:hypothetical protein
MAIVSTTSTAHTFRNAFVDMGRKDQFSLEALEALFEYYEELSEDTGEHIELDVIGICCEWSEMTSQDVADEYGEEIDKEDDEEYVDWFENVVESVRHSTIVLEVGNGNYLVMAH